MAALDAVQLDIIGVFAAALGFGLCFAGSKIFRPFSFTLGMIAAAFGSWWLISEGGGFKIADGHTAAADIFIVVLVGFVGGVVCLIFDKLVAGATLGYLVLAIFLALVPDARDALTQDESMPWLFALVAGLFIGFSSLLGLVKRFTEPVIMLCTAIVGAFGLVSGVSVLVLQQSVYDSIWAFMMEVVDIWDDQVAGPLSTQNMAICAVWAVVSLAGLAYQKYVRATLKRSVKEIEENFAKRISSVLGVGQEGRFSEVEEEGHTVKAANFIDLDNCPPELELVVHRVKRARLVAIFGFQPSNIRNQSEHLVMLLQNAQRSNRGWHQLHFKMLSNYIRWCRFMHIKPLVRLPGQWDATQGREDMVDPTLVEDLLLFLLIWGEAANLRFCPEFMCFLFHKMKHQWIGYVEAGSPAHLIAPNGFFLDHIIRPVYTVVKESTETIANCHKYNYDDLNEFFWSKNCLRFHHIDSTGQKILNGTADPSAKLKFRSPSSVDDMEASLVPMAAGGALANDLNAPLIPSVRLTHDPTDMNRQSSSQLERVLDKSGLAPDVVAPVCLELAKLRKTYPERRSWMHIVRSCNRIVDVYLLAFYVMVVLAFEEDQSSKMPLVSGVLTMAVGLSFMWELVDVWLWFPLMDVHRTTGSLVRMGVKLIFFALQASAFRRLAEDLNDEEAQQSYLLVCAPALVTYLATGIVQFLPSLSTCVRNTDNFIISSLMGLWWPANRLYVCKKVHESEQQSVWYKAFWISLLALKFYWSYYYEVVPLVPMTRKLLTKEIHYASTYSSDKNCTMELPLKVLVVVLTWTPYVIVYMIDIAIWYAVWQSLVGVAVGFWNGVGYVYKFSTVRKYFSFAPTAFVKQIAPHDDHSTETESRAATEECARGASDPATSEHGHDYDQEHEREHEHEHEHDGFHIEEKSEVGDEVDDAPNGLLPKPPMVAPPQSPLLDRESLDAMRSAFNNKSGPALRRTSGATTTSRGYESLQESQPGLNGGGDDFGAPSLRTATNSVSSTAPTDPLFGPSDLEAGQPGAGGPLRTSTGQSSVRGLVSMAAGLPGDVTRAKFAVAWDEIIREIRLDDIISNREASLLRFQRLSRSTSPSSALEAATTDTASHGKLGNDIDDSEGPEPIFIPLFQMAGVLDGVTAKCRHAGRQQIDQVSAASKADIDKQLNKELSKDPVAMETLNFTWRIIKELLPKLLGRAHKTETEAIFFNLEFIFSAGILVRLKPEALPALSSALNSLALTLRKTASAFKKLSASGTSASATNATNATNVGELANASIPNVSSSASMPTVSSTGSLESELDNAVAVAAAAEDTVSVPNRSESTSPPPTNASRRGSGRGGDSSRRSSRSLMRSRLAERSRKQQNAAVEKVREALKKVLSSVGSALKAQDHDNKTVDQLLKSVTTTERGFFWNDAYALEQLVTFSRDESLGTLLSKLNTILTLQAKKAEPASPEARRRLMFFVNSLGMQMRNPPPLRQMQSFSVLTPFYAEDVIYSKADLMSKTEDGLSTLLYLKTLYKKDWQNFAERTGIDLDGDDLSRSSGQRGIDFDVRLWASMRGQTLARTVNGMMRYNKALRLLAQLEGIPEEEHDALVTQKFSYVVACQQYSKQRAADSDKARDIEFLMHAYPGLRVAYMDDATKVQAVDEDAGTFHASDEQFSVLCKSNLAAATGGKPPSREAILRAVEQKVGIEEVYRIKLPGPAVIGEGKPENQNSAVIFTRGEKIQAIDMNQDHTLEECLKIRNLLQEFEPDRRSSTSKPTTIVGFREHIFTGSVSSVANYMALQELSFVTLGMRVLQTPLECRQHYGHPDIFDKVFFMGRGGMSKASKGINLSEDIFAGYNSLARGGRVKFSEYMQCGKGRDVGLMQISKFEAKLAQGNAEQCLSRDVARLADSLDFFRLLSFFYGGIGLYINTTLTVMLIKMLLYLNILFALTHIEVMTSGDLSALQGILAALGLLTALPLYATLIVEKGVGKGSFEFFKTILSGGILFFLLTLGCKEHYFQETINVGGAKYRATGRGFVTSHTKFDEIFRFYAKSHFFSGFELFVGLIIYRCTTMINTATYTTLTWTLWLVAFAWLFAPFWFNPSGLDSDKSLDGYKRWWRWMNGRGGTADDSWEIWWAEENESTFKRRWDQRLASCGKGLLLLAVSYNLVTTELWELWSCDKTRHMEKREEAAWLTLAFVIGSLMLVSLVYIGGRYFSNRYYRRTSDFLLFVGGLCLAIVGIANFGFAPVLRTLLAIYYLVAAVHNWVLNVVGENTFTREIARIHSSVVGSFLNIALLILAGLSFPAKVQTRFLFNNAMSRGIVVDDILQGSATSAASDDGRKKQLLEQNEALQKRVEQQQATIQRLIYDMDDLRRDTGASGGGGLSRGISNTSLATMNEQWETDSAMTAVV